MHLPLAVPDVEGRPKMPLASRQDFEVAVHCYWAKFLLSHSMLLLEELLPNHSTSLSEIAGEYTFVRPGPRFMLSQLLGDRASLSNHKRALGMLRLLTKELNAKTGAAWTVYGLQIVSSCGQHRVLVDAGVTFEPLPASHTKVPR